MWDARFTATFSKTDVKIYNTEDQCILTGTRNLQNHMLGIQVYLFPAVGPIIHYANVIVINTATKIYIVQYHHHSLGNPTSDTILKGIQKGFLATFPGLDEKYLQNIYFLALIQPKVTYNNSTKDYKKINFNPSLNLKICIL